MFYYQTHFLLKAIIEKINAKLHMITRTTFYKNQNVQA